MEFNFIVDKFYILLKMLSNRNNLEELKTWKDTFAKKIVDEKIITDIENNKETIEEDFIAKKYEQLFSEETLGILMNDEIFLKYLAETTSYMNSMQAHWLLHKDNINDWLKKKIKLESFRGKIDAYITHPKLNTGKCVNSSSIFFGHIKGINDKNYNIVYLCHEYLHSILPNEKCFTTAMNMYENRDKNMNSLEYWRELNTKYPDFYKVYDYEFDLVHTVIELISDNELYTLLNKMSMYQEGHNDENCSLVKYKEIILPYWFKYLQLSEEEINKRVTNVNEDIDTREINNLDNIEEFINFILDRLDLKKIFSIPSLQESKPKR